MAASLLDALSHFGIGDVAAVPSEQELGAMNGCHRDVGGVHACHGRHRTAIDQVAGQLQYIGGERKQRYPVKSIQPTLNCLAISGSCLANDDFRDSNGEARPTSTPPLCSDLLTCRSYQVRLGRAVR